MLTYLNLCNGWNLLAVCCLTAINARLTLCAGLLASCMKVLDQWLRDIV